MYIWVEVSPIAVCDDVHVCVATAYMILPLTCNVGC